jgi:TatD DNase family protein
MIDTHAHILNEYYDDIDSLVKMLKENKVLYVLNAASNYNESLEVLDLSKTYNNFLLPVIGIHPESINDKDNLNKIEDLIKNNKIYAVGEIGLDYYWVKDNKEEQKELFINQIKLAQKYNLPVVVHSRDAIQDTFDILKEHRVKGVIHSYSGSAEMAREFIKLGYKLGIGGVLTFKNSKLYEVIEKIDIENIVLETDSPYLTPEPYRGRENNPSNIYYVAKRISEIKGIDINKVLEITTKTAIQLFDI